MHWTSFSRIQIHYIFVYFILFEMLLSEMFRHGVNHSAVANFILFRAHEEINRSIISNIKLITCVNWFIIIRSGIIMPFIIDSQTLLHRFKATLSGSSKLNRSPDPVDK